MSLSIGFELPSEMRGSDEVPVTVHQEGKNHAEKDISGSKDSSKSPSTERKGGDRPGLRRRRGQTGEGGKRGDHDDDTRQQDARASDHTSDGHAAGSILDEEELERKIGSGKVVKMLGLTQDQVRMSVSEGGTLEFRGGRKRRLRSTTPLTQNCQLSTGICAYTTCCILSIHWGRIKHR